MESVILVCLCLASLSLSTLINFSSEQNIDKAEKWPGSQEPEDANYLTDLPKIAILTPGRLSVSPPHHGPIFVVVTAKWKAALLPTATPHPTHHHT